MKDNTLFNESALISPQQVDAEGDAHSLDATVLQTKPSCWLHCDSCHTPSTAFMVAQASAGSTLVSGDLPGQLL